MPVGCWVGITRITRVAGCVVARWRGRQPTQGVEMTPGRCDVAAVQHYPTKGRVGSGEIVAK